MSNSVVSDRDRNESGQYERELSDEMFLGAVHDLDTPTTTDIAEAVDCDRTSARYRLGLLEDEGEIESTKVGPALVWKRPD